MKTVTEANPLGVEAVMDALLTYFKHQFGSDFRERMPYRIDITQTFVTRTQSRVEDIIELSVAFVEIEQEAGGGVDHIPELVELEFTFRAENRI